MSHIHLPDGIIPVPWWLAGYLVAVLIIYLLLSRVDSTEARYRIPKAAMAAAFMLVAMSVPLGFLPIHLSMAVLAGILVGPGIGFLSVFVVNFILALVGHGGITIVGLNTLVIGLEVLVGAKIFSYLLSKTTVWKAAFLAVIPALIVSLVFTVSLVGATVSWAEALPYHQHDCDHDHDHDDRSHANHNGHDSHGHSEGNGEGIETALSEIHILTLTGWTALLVILAVGITLEAILTAIIANYIYKVKPDLLEATNSLPGR
ncbi:energy-coupling factor ABC transporter permease [Natranaerobius thermophilus]|uniref:ABC-type Co2+ transport system permease component-like protein n=1 Tax=Natranaerobius thermophilus (strain ATCC BAA-1301 / DSM 18059 / JW/NM-WN-LF) TaxID=457570 RepID=B2A6G7_NATTJ|nr:energy-coupling factor ABC transporter permease [Natranaerobius thermophilus]ACB85500.1 ABC-type Co2+ transport system permease component-like protein [Natranaerobius thermophilus JW/NM-WN-LF]